MPVVAVEIPARPPQRYAVHVERGSLLRAGELISGLRPGRGSAFVVTAPAVRKHWGDSLTASLAAAGLKVDVLEMQDGERHKNLDTVSSLATRMVQRGADRGSLVVALGGGVVGDTAGLLASLFMRGVDYVQVPTTVVAQLDAAIGGKTGVNLAAGKNLLGTFHHPLLVIADPQALATLPEREFRSGLFEAMKCGVIRSPEIFGYMEENRERILQRQVDAIEWLTEASVKVKAEVVAADEREGGLRRILNFGHTIGHALEAETGYKQFLHGEAVAWGMVAASLISSGMQRTGAELARRIISQVLAYAPLPKIEVKGKRIARRLQADKKTRNGVVHFVLPVELGRVDIVPDVPERAVVQAVEELRYLSSV
ncbi:MAG: 3-dehydroquinate synthase [Acidobacteria bacterium]|nr:3-dehydroquinate synthase [Acidobacteriota bacterium]